MAKQTFIIKIERNFLPDFCKVASTDKTKNKSSNDKAMLIISPFATLIAKLIPTSNPSIKTSIATAINSDVVDLPS